MPNESKSPLHFLEKLVTPFHNMTLTLTAISALSLHALLSQFFEPLVKIYYTVLLTFPLTVGLLIIALIAYNINWNKINLVQILVTPFLLALLFKGLTAVSDRYGLEKLGREEEKAHASEKIEQHNSAEKRMEGDTSVHAKDSNDTLHANDHSSTINENIKKMIASGPTAPAVVPEVPWYRKIGPVNMAISGCVMLKESFARMYFNYGATRFISGVVLALMLAWYVQHKGIARLKS